MVIYFSILNHTVNFTKKEIVMDFGEIIALAISALFLVFVVFGFLVGFLRGLKKTVIRTIWILLIGVGLIFATTPLALYAVRSDITWIPGIEGVFKGCTSVEEFIALTVSQSLKALAQKLFYL